MATKKNEEPVIEPEEVVHEVRKTDPVYDLEALWSMKFLDPVTGSVLMVRKAYKPRGKLEFYTPSKG